MAINREDHLIDGLCKFLKSMAKIRERLHEAAIEWNVSPEVQEQLDALAKSVDADMDDVIEFVGDLSEGSQT